MSSFATSSIAFACLAGFLFVGMFLRRVLPERHLSAESKDLVKLGMGLIGTMAALVLGLMVGSAKSAYDAQKNNLLQMSVKIILLDKGLAHYGPETKEIRANLRAAVARILAQIWPADSGQASQLDPKAARVEGLYDQIQALAPKNDAQRSIQTVALSFMVDIGQLRWMMFQQSGSAISTPFLIVLVFWLSVIFAGFGMMAPPNPTTTVVLILCALSVSGALFLVLELDRPFEGLIQIPSTPLANALAQLGQ
jgi:hypothetical protein